MSDGEDENIIMGDDDYKEEEEAITTMTDVSSTASLLPHHQHPLQAILDSTITVDTQMTMAKR